jgi:hypothetical protein
MDKGNEACIHNGVLFSDKEQNYVICRKMDRTGDHHIEWISPAQKSKYLSDAFTFKQNIGLK